VLAKLQDAKRPMTAHETVDVLRPKDAAATPASVYCSLGFQFQHGAVQRLEPTRSVVASAAASLGLALDKRRVELTRTCPVGAAR
jgi:Fe2+ or Zn2+ uptake regulation protein